MCRGEPSVTATILPPSPPPLFPLGAIKNRLAKFSIHFVVRFTHPVPKLLSVVRLDGFLLEIGLKVFGAHPARIELRKESKETLNVGLIARCWFCWVLGGYGM